MKGPLKFAHAPVRAWFENTLGVPTLAQREAWPAIAAGKSTLLLAPTGSGKTLAAFLAAIDRLMFEAVPPAPQRCRVLYISPLKALGVDVERNLRVPLAGIHEAAEQAGTPHHVPTVGIRTGDTSPSERARMARRPPDILITTPESLYLILTSQASRILGSVDTVIVDEIHAVAATKRGAHLMVSLERLEALRERSVPLQRIGLSATQHPLEEMARLLGGHELQGGAWTERPVEIVDAGATKKLELRVEYLPPTSPGEAPGEDAVAAAPSIWPAIHERLVELVRAHRSTMIFVNSRRLAERLATALNDVADEALARAHHGSLAAPTRRAVEEALKQGELRALVATSSLELGIDMGAIDLVVQIEAPVSIASGLQRIGRSGHTVDAVARGVLFPKQRGDLLAAAASVPAMREARIEATRYPRNPLDVLAQQITATVAMRPWPEDELFALVRRAAPFADLPRSAFADVLDMLSGRYTSEAFEGLRPRVTWDRDGGMVTARRGAHRIAVSNPGTIPDRGLFGVYLAGDDGKRSKRVGELDEEMVYESRIGDVFLLGASSWRIQEITPDRVRVVPAPGESGRMPFWRGEGPGRSMAFGREIGALARRIETAAAGEAEAWLQAEHGLAPEAASALVAHLESQVDAGSRVPTDRRIVVEVFPDEIGDPRVAILSPFGARVHAPWAAALRALWRRAEGLDLETTWNDDGIMMRLPPHADDPPRERFVPSSDGLSALVQDELARMPVFAARFRESAGRALLLPRRMPGRRMPLWIQRRRSADLLAFTSGYPDFPIVLETYRECLQDLFDLPALAEVLREVEEGRIALDVVHTRVPSPFTSALAFDYTAAWFYEGDAPPAERRAHALTIDHGRLKELLGEAELRGLLHRDAIQEVGARLPRRGARTPLAHPDDVHDLLLAQGERSTAELQALADEHGDLEAWLQALEAARRIVALQIGGKPYWIAVEDAARCRDALGCVLPDGLPPALLLPTRRPLETLLLRFARGVVPFAADRPAARFGLDVGALRSVLDGLAAQGRLVAGAFLPDGEGEEYCHPEVLRAIKRSSLARVRASVEAVPQTALQRFAVSWHGLHEPRADDDALLDVVAMLQGVPLPASVLERDVLPARIRGYRPGDLDGRIASGEVTWRGVQSLGSRDGRVALYLGDEAPLLAPEPREVESELAMRVEALLGEQGALFFRDLLTAIGAYPGDLLEALWELVWAGRVSNDSLVGLRRRLAGAAKPVVGGRRRRETRQGGRPGSEGRWYLVAPVVAGATERAKALVEQLLDRHGLFTREVLPLEGRGGGFTALYPVLRGLEEAGRVQRGYFVEGLGALQYALPSVPARLRNAQLRAPGTAPLVLAATDPAHLYGAALPWPAARGGPPKRQARARVVLQGGRLLAWIAPGTDRLLTFPCEPAEEGALARDEGEAVASALRELLHRTARPALLLETVDAGPASESALRPYLEEVGFRDTLRGMLLRAADVR